MTSAQVHQKQNSASLAAGAFTALLILGAPLVASAATLCVNKTGTGGCFTTIGAAVTAAAAGDIIKVQSGTFAEDVIIGKSLSITGMGPQSTVVDSTGLSNGFFVDGLDNPGLSNVLVSGFTVQNANFEGILVANASSVTISNNTVTSNNKSLDTVAMTCTGIPDYETEEGDDCGEGIHLLGANHSIVANNQVMNNSGGILTSDDTGPASHNLITGNVVTKNPFDCGITFASHFPALLTGSTTPRGVTQNTISGNTSTLNGLGLPGAGAGVGIFVGAPNGIDSGNVVVNNTLTNNGLPGVTMHSHASGEVFTDNVIIGNQISGNAADTADAATSGTTGINVFGVSPASGTIISGNKIRGESLDVVVNTPASVDVQRNNLLGSGVGVETLNAGIADAPLNYWGCANGPGAAGCTTLSGAGITSKPFSSRPF